MERILFSVLSLWHFITLLWHFCAFVMAHFFGFMVLFMALCYDTLCLNFKTTLAFLTALSHLTCLMSIALPNLTSTFAS